MSGRGRTRERPGAARWSVALWAIATGAALWAALRDRHANSQPPSPPEIRAKGREGDQSRLNWIALCVALVAFALSLMTIPGSPFQMGVLLGGDPARSEDLVVQTAGYDAERVDGAAAFLVPVGSDVRFPEDLYPPELDGYCDGEERAGLGALGFAANPYIHFNLTNTHTSSETATLHITGMRLRVTEIMDAERSVALVCPTGGDKAQVVSARISRAHPRVGDEFAFQVYHETSWWDDLGQLDPTAGPPVFTVSPGETVTLIAGVKSLHVTVRGRIIATVTNGEGHPQDVDLTEGLGPISVAAIDSARTEVHSRGGNEYDCAVRDEFGNEGQSQSCSSVRGSTVMEMIAD